MWKYDFKLKYIFCFMNPHILINCTETNYLIQTIQVLWYVVRINSSVYTVLIFILLKNVFTMQRFLMLSFDHLSKSFMKFYSFYILTSSVRLLRSVHNLFKKCICFQSKCLTSHLDVLAFKHTCTHTHFHTQQHP